jgi:hypothetical protein
MNKLHRAGLFLLLFLITLSTASQSTGETRVSDDIQELSRIASTLRKLPLKRDVRAISVDRDKFRSLAHSAVRRDVGLPLTRQKQILVFLGLLPSDYPFERCIIDEYSRRAMAFYSPSTKLITLPSWYRVDKAIIVHEITHALQDQHFQTRNFGVEPFLFDDRNLAAAILLEGDAMHVEEQYRKLYPEDEKDVSPFQLPSESPECELPASLQTLASGIYDYGIHFFNVMEKDGKSTEHFFHTPPSTTSELLYRTAPSPSMNERTRRQIIIGELNIRTILKSFISPRLAVLAGKGWKSDSLRFLGTGERQIQWTTEWSSEKDADEFFAAWVSSWEKRTGLILSKSVSSLLFDLPGGEVVITRKGCQVVTVWSPHS